MGDAELACHGEVFGGLLAEDLEGAFYAGACGYGGAGAAAEVGVVEVGEAR